MAKEINLFESNTGAPRITGQLTSLGFIENPEEVARRIDKEQKALAKKIVEALLFASQEPISFQRLREIVETKLPLKPKILKSALEDLEDDYIREQRAFRLQEVAEGFILRTCEEYAPFIERLFRSKRPEKLSHASTEVLAIIAYKQPITRPQIDAIRGVDSSGIVDNLLERSLIQSAGKLEAPGRPTLYATTPHFLSHFGLKDLKELPTLKKPP